MTKKKCVIGHIYRCWVEGDDELGDSGDFDGTTPEDAITNFLIGAELSSSTRICVRRVDIGFDVYTVDKPPVPRLTIKKANAKK